MRLAVFLFVNILVASFLTTTATAEPKFTAHTALSKSQLAKLDKSAKEFKRKKRKLAVKVSLPTANGLENVELVPNADATAAEVKSYLMTENGPVEDPHTLEFFKSKKKSGNDFVRVALVRNKNTGERSVRGFMRRKGKVYNISPTSDSQLGSMSYSRSAVKSDGSLEMAVSEMNLKDATRAFSECGLDEKTLHNEIGVTAALLSGEYMVASTARPVLETTVATDADYEYYAANGADSNARIRNIITNLVAPIYEQQLRMKLELQFQQTWTSKSVPGYPFTAGRPTSMEFEALWAERLRTDSTFEYKTPGFRILYTGRSLGGSTVGEAGVGFFCGGSAFIYGNLNDATVAHITAHELGHSVGMFHLNGGSVMNPVVNNSMTFAAKSLGEAEAHIITKIEELPYNGTACVREAGRTYYHARARVVRKSNGQPLELINVDPGEQMFGGNGFSNAQGIADFRFNFAGRPYAFEISNRQRRYGLPRELKYTASAPVSGVLNSNIEITFTVDDVNPGSDPVTIPTITKQPVSVTVNEGQSATFSVTATGGSLSYQWKKDGQAIPGANAASYSFTANRSDNGAAFTVIVQNTKGSKTSAAASLKVNFQSAGRLITKAGSFRPTAKKIKVGSKVSFVAVLNNAGSETITGISARLTINHPNSPTKSLSRATLKPKANFSARWSNFWTAPAAGTYSATMCITASSLPAFESCESINFTAK